MLEFSKNEQQYLLRRVAAFPTGGHHVFLANFGTVCVFRGR